MPNHLVMDKNEATGFRALVQDVDSQRRTTDAAKMQSIARRRSAMLPFLGRISQKTARNQEIVTVSKRNKKYEPRKQTKMYIIKPSD